MCMDTTPRVVGDITYVHYTTLHQWAENREARILHKKDWERLLKSLEKYGVKDTLEVGDDGTVYDGNHRLEGVTNLIESGVITADNGKDLAWLPVRVNHPQTDAEVLALVLSGNDNNYAIYNKEWIMNNQERIEQVEDYEDISVQGEEPMTLEEAFDYPEGDGDDQDDAANQNAEENKPQATNTTRKEITCPQCAHTFIFKG